HARADAPGAEPDAGRGRRGAEDRERLARGPRAALTVFCVPRPPADAPITESDDFLADALTHASVPTLMMTLVHVTGDPSILRGAVRPGNATMGEVDGGMSAEDKIVVRQLALDALRAYRDRGCTLPPPPSAEVIQEMMSFMVGAEVPAEYVPMMLE